MADPAAPASAAGTFHALLIGVNDYEYAPLSGCVSDVDAMQRVLLGPRMRLANGRIRIRRLTSPCSGARHHAVTEQPATLANLRDALAELGSDKVSAGDRVFIFYSGHGAQLEVTAPDGRRAHREVLVPVDYAARPPSPQVLPDFEINTALRAIVARTRSVAVMLDCCFAAGVTRAGLVPPDWLPRFIDLGRRSYGGRAAPAQLPAPAPRLGGGEDRGFGGVDACHVVSACLNHEVAREHTRDGVRNGLLTRAFIEALEAATEAELASVTWAQIWQAMQAYVAQHNASQHLWMAGNAGRAVFAGPPVERDPGLPVIRAGDDVRIEAGTLADVTRGALVAVYGDRPAYFPPLDSEDDRRARVGVLRVTAADLATATATVDGAPFELQPGARGRLVQAGVAARLRCAVVPPDPVLQARLAASPLLDVVDDAVVKLEQHGDRWFVTDAIHGKQPPAPILLAFPPGQLDGARAVLEHYHAYSRPLRMAERIHDLNGGLTIRVLQCPRRGVRAADAALPDGLSEVRLADGKCALSSGDTVCFEARNLTDRELRVTLVNCAASGKVQVLGDQVIVPERSYVFWAGNVLGAPFEMSPPPGVSHCVDRMIAIGRTALGHALDHLRVDQTFAQVVDRYRSGKKDITGSVQGAVAPLEHWAASQVVIETRT